MLRYIYISVVKYYIGTEDSEEEDAVQEKTNKPPGFNDIGVFVEKPKTDDTSNDKHKQESKVGENPSHSVAINPPATGRTCGNAEIATKFINTNASYEILINLL